MEVNTNFMVYCKNVIVVCLYNYKIHGFLIVCVRGIYSIFFSYCTKQLIRENKATHTVVLIKRRDISHTRESKL